MSGKPCLCGSGQYRRPLRDARGIFVTYVCDDCEEEKRKNYRADIFTDANYDCTEDVEEDR